MSSGRWIPFRNDLTVTPTVTGVNNGEQRETRDPGIWLIYAILGVLKEFRYPLRSGLYQLGCSTVAVRARQEGGF